MPEPAKRIQELPPTPCPGHPPGEALRQLRHLTRNALQRILVQVMEAPGIDASPTGRALAREVERRITLSVAISDALFGLTRRPARFPDRLKALSRNVIDLYADPAQIIRLGLNLDAILPPRLEPPVLGIVHELVGNAVKHGFHARLLGRIEISLATGGAGSLLLKVANDGWPIDVDPAQGEGLALVAELAGAEGGEVRVRQSTVTAIEIRLPLDPPPLHSQR